MVVDQTSYSFDDLLDQVQVQQASYSAMSTECKRAMLQRLMAWHCCIVFDALNLE